MSCDPATRREGHNVLEQMLNTGHDLREFRMKYAGKCGVSRARRLRRSNPGFGMAGLLPAAEEKKRTEPNLTSRCLIPAIRPKLIQIYTSYRNGKVEHSRREDQQHL